VPTTPAIVWFRHDLRLADNPALQAALDHGGPVVPVFIWSPDEEGGFAPGGASRWWLHHSLAALAQALDERGSRLLIRRGPALDVLLQLIRETDASAVFWNDRYEPAALQRDLRIRSTLDHAGIEAAATTGAVLYEPWAIHNKAGKPYQVFTPFWKACLAAGDPPAPLSSPDKLPGLESWPECLPLDSLALLPKGTWASGLRGAWQPGEPGARASLAGFLTERLADYEAGRNRPDRNGTSRLSPHLHFGEISPRQVWHACVRNPAAAAAGSSRGSVFLAEIGWREFAHHLLFHFPDTTGEPLKASFRNFPWNEDPALLRAWQRGQTGYPLVDAGMRQLWATGWMHNRVRMVVGSFLVKDLLIDWRRGADWFWDTLVDADLANNTLGWQWVAGCGADAAPYFRVFNPVAQGEKFDPQGDYVRRWVPELAGLPARWIHKPFAAPSGVLRSAGVEIGGTYPAPVVSHDVARLVALEAYRRIRQPA
jgi:deoxyribodipyrimidine photo-lyase